MTHAAAFGIISSLLTLLSRGNYFAAIFKSKTRPHAFSWFIWGVISSIGVAAQASQGGGAGAWAAGLASGSCYVVVLIALFKGERNIRRSDWITLLVALSAIPLWIATKTPVYSVMMVCTIDTMGWLPTVRKSWHNPHQEAARSYLASCGAAFFSILALEHYTLSTWLYPAVLTCSNGSMAAYLFLRRRVLNSPLNLQSAQLLV